MAKMTRAQRDKALKAIARKRRAAAPAFEDDTPEKKRARKAACERDVFLFADTYLPHYVTDETPEFHREWNDLAEIICKLTLVCAPRGHGKSAVFSLMKILHWTAYNKRLLAILASDTQTQAENLLSFVAEELKNNERLKNDFGEFYQDGSWEASEIVTRQGVMIVARGKGASLRGLRNGPHRPDAFVGDDIENDEEQKNPRRVEKTLDWVLRVVIPAMNPKGWTGVIVGTLLSKKSALARLMTMKQEGSEAPLYVTRIYRAITIEGEPLFPSRFTLDYLIDIRTQIGSRAFNAEYMNDPKDDEGAFREEWIREAREDGAAIEAIAIYTDPSIGETKKNDYKATVAVGSAGATARVLMARIRKESLSASINGVFDIYEALRALYPHASIDVGFESNGFQKLLKRDYEEIEKERGVRLPLRMIENHSNKEARIESLSPLIESGKLLFTRNQTDQETLIEQLVYFGSSTVHDDGPDALEAAVRILDRFKSRRAEYSTVSRRASYNAVRVENAGELAGVAL
ncbi:MAG: phage terminase large subunit [Nitrospinae bacterium]|nr:phage terminase large subunit [Nitrospinota bacterium]